MSAFIIVNNDGVQFTPTFGSNTVTALAPGKIIGSGEATIQNKKICVVGDEKKVSVSATYFNAAFPNAGKGSITITSLAPDQIAMFVTATAPAIVAGSRFQARFTPEVPATNAQGVADPNKLPSPGTGWFINSQTFVSAG